MIEQSKFRVLGSGAVYAVDGADVIHSNIAEGGREDALSMFGVRLHVLSAGDGFDLKERQPNHLDRDSDKR